MQKKQVFCIKIQKLVGFNNFQAACFTGKQCIYTVYLYEKTGKIMPLKREDAK